MINYCLHTYLLCWILLFVVNRNGLELVEGSWRICCPSYWWLVEVTTQVADDVNETNYLCHRHNKDSSLDPNGSTIRALGMAQPLDSPSSTIAQFSSLSSSLFFLNCSNPLFKTYRYRDVAYLSVPLEFSCMMRTGFDDLLVMTCSSDSNTSNAGSEIQIIPVVHKCCPLWTRYELEERKCISEDMIDENSTTEVKWKAYPLDEHPPIIYRLDPFECPLHKLLVEYSMDSIPLSVSQGKNQKNIHEKILMIGGNRFSATEYCLEPVHHFEVDGNRLPMKYLIRVCIDHGERICQKIPCIRRCCYNENQVVARGNGSSYCKTAVNAIKERSGTPFFQSFQSLTISANFTKPREFGIWRGLECRKYRLDPDAYPDDAHTISTKNGSVFVNSSQKFYTNEEYCIERIRFDDLKLYTFLCFDTEVISSDRIRFTLYTTGIFISCLFYTLTLLAYMIVARLRNLPGKIQMCLIACLLVAYLSIALGQMMPTSNNSMCSASGFFIYFCLVAAFSWMNVMCFDIWQTFGSSKVRRKSHTKQQKRFLLYSLYGWGMPSLLTIVTVSLTESSLLKPEYRPQFGHGRCWFTYDSARAANLVFFSGPIGLLFVVNFILFVLTLRYCNQVRREINRMQSSNQEKVSLKCRFRLERSRFAMNTKLFVVMGINWLLELLSIIFYNHKQVFFWAISDSFNVLLGVFVFFIFVFKKRIWEDILMTLGIRESAQSQSRTGHTPWLAAAHSKPISTGHLKVTEFSDCLLPAETNKSIGVSI